MLVLSFVKYLLHVNVKTYIYIIPVYCFIPLKSFELRTLLAWIFSFPAYMHAPRCMHACLVFNLADMYIYGQLYKWDSLAFHFTITKWFDS